MKKKKTLLIVIIVLLVILILGGGTFAYIYLGTDLLKSDKELFAKYIVLMGDDEEGFSPKILADYESKKETTPYQNNGSFSVNNEVLSNDNLPLEILGVFQALVEKSNETNISFSGKTDRTNMLVEEDISINYSDTVNLPFKYKQDGDLYGIQADIFSSNYFALENDNLPDLLLKLGATDVSGIPNKIEPKVVESLKFSNDEKTNILNNYILPIYNNLAEEKFSKVENSDGTNDYLLTLTSVEIKDIALQILQTLSNDEIMLAKINSIAQELYGNSIDTITSQDIQSLVGELSELSVENGNLVITITEEDRKTTGLMLDISSDESIVNLNIDKEQTESNIVYNITGTGKSASDQTLYTSANIQMVYSGINTDNVSENINVDIAISDVMNLSYSYNNNISFGNISIEPFDTNNVAILNDYPAEQLQPFILQLGYIIAQTNSTYMQQIGYSEEFINPMFIWFTAPVIYSSIYQQNALLDRAEQAQNLYEQDTLYTQEAITNTELYINEILSGQ